MKPRNSTHSLLILVVALGGAFSLLAQTPDNPPQGFGGQPPGGGPGFGGPPQFGEGGTGPGGFGGGGPGGRGGFGGPGAQETKLVKQFDKNNDKWLNAEERQAAREYLKQRGGGRGPGGRRGGPGGRGGNEQPAQPGRKLSPADVKSFPSAPLYDPNTLRTLFIEFDAPDWEKELADFHKTDVDVPARVIVDGKTYKDVGVHFHGMSSFMMVSEGSKRSLVLTFDFIHDKQELNGYRTLNLLNSHEDASFLRTVLSLQVARDYLPAPKANFVCVVINGESWGVYANQQHFNKEFLQENYGTTKGARWKVPGSPNGRGSLAYLGDDPEAYKRIYDIKTKDDSKSWSDLIKLCKVLNQTPAEQLESALAPLLDVDSALKFLAWEVALVNGDGYWTRTSDYSLYEDDKGRFHVIPYDANETFSTGGGPGGGRGGRGFGGPGGRGGGGFGQPPGQPGGPQPGGQPGGGFAGGPGGPDGPGGGPGAGPRGGFAGGPGGPDGPGGPGMGPDGGPGQGRGPGFGGGMRGGGVELDPLIGLNDASKPLRTKLLAVPALRARYLGYVRDIAEKWLDWNKLGPIAKQYHALIADEVKLDTRKLDSTQDFLNSLEAEAPAQPSPGPGGEPGFGRGGRGGPGGPRMSLQAFAEKRRTYLLNNTDVKNPPK